MIDTGIRYAEKSDIPYLVKVWKACFDDDEEYIRLFYSENFERISVLVYADGGVPVSILHIFDCDFVSAGEQQRAKFLYAGASLPEHRRHGYFSRLMKYMTNMAEQDGFALFHKPTAELVDYYKGLGFEPDSYFRHVTVIPGKMQPIAATSVSATQYNKMRNAAFAGIPHVKWSDSYLDWCVKENEYFSGKAFAFRLDGDDFFVMGAPEGDAFLITETNLTLSQLKLASAALCDMFGAKRIKAYIPERSCNEGERIIASVVYNSNRQNTYVNLILI